MSDANAILMSGGAPTAQFPEKGTVVKGVITKIDTIQQRDFLTKEPLVWDDGKPRMQVVLTLQTELRDPDIDNDDGTRRLFLKIGMQKAVREAVIKAGAAGLDEGGTLAVKWVGEEPPSKPGLSPKKLYAAEYKPPAPSVDLLDDDTGLI